MATLLGVHPHFPLIQPASAKKKRHGRGGYRYGSWDFVWFCLTLRYVLLESSFLPGPVRGTRDEIMKQKVGMSRIIASICSYDPKLQQIQTTQPTSKNSFTRQEVVALDRKKTWCMLHIISTLTPWLPTPPFSGNKTLPGFARPQEHLQSLFTGCFEFKFALKLQHC